MVSKACLENAQATRARACSRTCVATTFAQGSRRENEAQERAQRAQLLTEALKARVSARSLRTHALVRKEYCWHTIVRRERDGLKSYIGCPHRPVFYVLK